MFSSVLTLNENQPRSPDMGAAAVKPCTLSLLPPQGSQPQPGLQVASATHDHSPSHSIKMDTLHMRAGTSRLSTPAARHSSSSGPQGCPASLLVPMISHGCPCWQQLLLWPCQGHHTPKSQLPLTARIAPATQTLPVQVMG